MPISFDDLIPQQQSAPAASGGMFDDLVPQSQAPQSAPQQSAPSGFGASALDVAKQLPTGIAQGIEAMPATVPLLTGLAGQGADALLKNVAPGLIDPQQEQNQQTVRDLAMKARNGGISQYLPQATTPAGEAANTVGNFLPSALGMSGGLVKNAISGTAAGLGAHAAGQLAPDNASKPYLQAGGAILGGGIAGGIADATSAAKFTKTLPSIADTKTAATDMYTLLRSGHVEQPVQQELLDNLASSISAKVNKMGPRPSVAPGGHAAINEIKTPATEGKPDVADLVSARQNMKQFFANPLPDPNKAVAAIAVPMLDAAIEKASPGTMKLLREADKNYSAASVAGTFDKKITQAELQTPGSNSGMNLGNKIRQKTAQMLASNKESRGLTPEGEAALKGVNNGTPFQNALQFGSRALGGGGGIAPTVMALGALGAGYETGHPGLAALPILGFGMRALENRLIASQAQQAKAALLSQSPLARRMGVGTPPASITNPQSPALSAIFALPAVRAMLSQQR